MAEGDDAAEGEEKEGLPKADVSEVIPKEAGGSRQ